MSRSRQYHIYRNMRKRCDDSTCKDYKNYGGRGITYCGKWETFEGFWEDMGQRYSDNLTLERIDNNKNYCKENCRWATKQEQSNNRRGNKKFDYLGQSLTLTQIGRKYNIDAQTLEHRLNFGLSVKEALEHPKYKRLRYSKV